MRGIRIAAFSVAAFLACLVISHMSSVEPADDDDSQAAGFEASQEAGHESAPTIVPAPPPLRGEPSARPAKKLPADAPPAPEAPAHENLAQVQFAPDSQPFATDVASLTSATADGDPAIWQVNELAADSSEAQASANVEGASAESTAGTVDQPNGLVIVVPEERSKTQSRGSRWLRAVGRALGIGRPKDPVELSFQE